ncbi:hypothetical protein [Eubacterium sp.]|nr:hypothetical protein [Eubacterium sp.]MDY3812642.1 hypothetical protein [Eubacterium sp.]
MNKKCKRDYLFVAFGVGCVLACCLPTIWVTRMLAVSVIILGIIICCRK